MNTIQPSKLAIVVVSLVLIGLLLAASPSPQLLSSGQQSTTTTTSSPSSSSGTAVQVIIEHGAAANPNSSGYSPDAITVTIGVNNTVAWVNQDSAPHTVTANDGSFDSGNLNAGDNWTYTFLTPGTYYYVCSYHPWMGGTVIVLPTAH